MIPYLISWSLLGFQALVGSRRWSQSTVVALLLFFTLFIGLRYDVGGDWENYLSFIESVQGFSFSEMLMQDEAGYAIFNWFGANWFGGLFLVDTLCALIFSWGLLRFCRAQPLPWLALTLAFPYLILVVAMGYSRQGVAIGLECLALLALERDRLLWFLGLVAVAATFHKTALVLMVLPVSSLSPNLRFSQLIRLALLVVAGYGLFNTLLSSSIDKFQSGYLDQQLESEGALVRVLLSLLPALVFLLFRHRFQLPPQLLRIWTLLSFGAIVAALGLFTVASSTVIDRLALYLIPLQIFVGSRLPDTRLFGLPPSLWNQVLISLSLAVLLVWLFFAVNAQFWLPYRNILLPF